MLIYILAGCSKYGICVLIHAAFVSYLLVLIVNMGLRGINRCFFFHCAWLLMYI